MNGSVFWNNFLIESSVLRTILDVFIEIFVINKCIVHSCASQLTHYHRGLAEVVGKSLFIIIIITLSVKKKSAESD